MKHIAGVPQAYPCSVTYSPKAAASVHKTGLFWQMCNKTAFLFGENDDYRKNVKKYLKKYFEVVY